MAAPVTLTKIERIDVTSGARVLPQATQNRSIEDLKKLAEEGAGTPHSFIALRGILPSGWYIMSVKNETSQDRWWLEFGKPPIGRSGILDDLWVYDLSANRLVLNALEQNPQRNARHGIALALPAGQTSHFAIYASTQAPRSFISTLTLRPEDLPASIVDAVGFGNVALVALLAGIGFLLLTAGSVYHLPTGLSAALAFTFPLIHAVFLTGPVMGWADPTLALGMPPWFLMSGLCWFLATLLQTRGGAGTLSGIALLMALVSISALLFAFVFGTSTVSVEVKVSLLRIAPLVPMLAALLLCVQNNMLGRGAGRYAVFAAAAGIIGQILFIAGMAFQTLPSFIVFAPWVALPVQGLCFAALLFSRGEARFADRLRQESLKLRESEQLARMKQSKEAADQARLMRVIEREREVMEELRVREAQRSEEMRLAKESADEANRAKGAFLAVVSHEIRTPMTGIMGMVRLLLESTLNASQREYAQTIKDSGDSMLRLLNDILDFSKIEKDKMELEDIEFDLPQVLRSIVTLMSGQAGGKGLDLKTDIGEDVPRFVRGDPARLRQVLLNLVNNAIKFTSKGSVTLGLHKVVNNAQSEAAAEGGALPYLDEDRYIHGLTFAVTDTGIGIDPEAQKSIFNPFSQADSSITRKFGGTGLGLAICKRLVEAMGGAIMISSTPGEGSTFYFTLRMAEGFSDETANNEEQQAQLNQSVRLPALSVLVVEDNEINQRVLREMLERDNHRVSIASDGREAVMLTHQNSYELIIMDDELPELNGGAATEMIRAGDGPNKNTPIIGVTGNAHREDVIRLQNNGMNEVVAKPIDPARLRAAMNTVIAGEQNMATETMDAAPPVQEKSGGIPVLDMAMLGTLKETLGDASLKELIDSLVQKADEIVVEIKQAAGEGDIDMLGRKGHEMKGMAGNFGLMALSHAGAVLEKAGKSKNLDTARYLAETMDAQLSDAKEELAKFMG